MNRILLIFFLFTIHLQASAQIDKVIPPVPNPPVLYNDLTAGKKFLSSGDAKILENKLVAYDDSSSNQIAVVIVDDLQGYEANQYATALGDKWGVGGQAQFDNGVVVLISTGGEDGNRDAYIATGRGLEGAIPDMTAASIVDNELIPNLKSGDYFRALDKTTDAIMRAAAGEYKAPANYGSKKKKGPSIPTIIIIVIILIIIFAGGAGPGGTYVSRGGFGGWTGGGSSGGGGGWSGGGSSGGGFGGFGGGSFGGGGAGGKW